MSPKKAIVTVLRKKAEEFAVAGKLLMGISKDERKEGRAGGRTESHADVAHNLLKAEMPVEEIIAVTGLTCADIEVLRDKD